MVVLGDLGSRIWGSRCDSLGCFWVIRWTAFYDRINTIYQFIKTFLDKKMSVFEEYGAFNYHLLSETVQRSEFTLLILASIALRELIVKRNSFAHLQNSATYQQSLHSNLKRKSERELFIILL